MSHDTDGFNRYEASQRLALSCLRDLTVQAQKGIKPVVPAEVLDAYGTIIAMAQEEPLSPGAAAMVAEMLILPEVPTILQQMDLYDYEAAHKASEALHKGIAQRFEKELFGIYNKYKEDPSIMRGTAEPVDLGAMQRRKLKNRCLHYLVKLGGTYTEAAWEQFINPGNFDNETRAFEMLVNTARREDAITHFYEKWKDNADPNVLITFLVSVGRADDPEILQRVRTIVEKKDKIFFDITDGVKVANFLTFGYARNWAQYHRPDGAGYGFLGEIVPKIPNIARAIGLVREGFSTFTKLDPERQAKMRTVLESLRDHPTLDAKVKKEVLKVLGEQKGE